MKYVQLLSVDVNNIGILNSSEQKDQEERRKWVFIFILVNFMLVKLTRRIILNSVINIYCKIYEY